MTSQHRFDVTSSDGLTLAAFRYGTHNPGVPTLLAVHGYPDNHHVWDAFARSVGDRANVYTYDVRGAGESDAPAENVGKAGYRFEQLTADIARVIDAIGEVSGDRSRVHLIGHDWGSIQSWHAVTDDSVAERTASYTSVSGPNLHHVGEFLRGAKSLSDVRPRLRQAIGSAYIPVFLTPGLADGLYRRGWGQKLVAVLDRPGSAASTTEGYERSERDFLNGLNLYRANMPRPLLKPEQSTTSVPVQILCPERDLFVTPPMQRVGLAKSPDSRLRTIPGGHWVVSQNPGPLADATLEWIEAHR